MEKSQFYYLMVRLTTAFNEPMDEERVKIYYEFLGKEDYQKTFDAINNLIKESKWFPKIADLEKEINPKFDSGEEFYKYLDRCNNEFDKTIKALEYKPSLEEERKGAVECLKKITGMLKDREIKPILEGERAEEFERKRLEAKEKLKQLN